jgi:adenylosuccinate lyase
MAPFLATTTVLMEAVKGGAGREAAHAAIKEHALAAAEDLRQGRPPALLERLAADPRLGLDAAALRAALSADERFVGAALRQVDRFLAETEAVLHDLPRARQFRPGGIL